MFDLASGTAAAIQVEKSVSSEFSSNRRNCSGTGLNILDGAPRVVYSLAGAFHIGLQRSSHASLSRLGLSFRRGL